MKKCPYCAEELQDEAIFCRFCGHSRRDEMTDKWEMCYLNFLGNQMKFYSPGKTPNYKSCDKYVLSRGGSDNVWYGADVVIPILLNDSWEPFAVQNNQEYVFKRRVNPENPAGHTDFLGKA